MAKRNFELEDEKARLDFLSELVQVRKESGLRQIDVARLMGVAQPSVSGLESGATSPKLETLQKYARAIGVTIGFTIEESD